jgi:hypothetical protein
MALLNVTLRNLLGSSVSEQTSHISVDTAAVGIGLSTSDVLSSVTSI